MNKKHLFWLCSGILFWSIIPVILAGLVVNKGLSDIISHAGIVLFFTIIVVLLIQEIFREFKTNINPKSWFFIPLLCWILFSCVQLFEPPYSDRLFIFDLIVDFFK